MSQLASLSKEVANLSSRLDKFIADKPRARVVARKAYRREHADLFKSEAAGGSFTKAVQQLPLGGADLFKGYPEYDDTQARDAEGQWTGGVPDLAGMTRRDFRVTLFCG